jgi:hypothetical protein
MTSVSVSDWKTSPCFSCKTRRSLTQMCHMTHAQLLWDAARWDIVKWFKKRLMSNWSDSKN